MPLRRPLLTCCFLALPWATVSADTAESTNKRLFLVTPDGLVTVPTEGPKIGIPSVAEPFTTGRAVQLVVDPDRRQVWAVSVGRISLHRADGSQAWSVVLAPIEEPQGPSGPTLRSTAMSSDGSLWIARGQNLRAFGASGQELHQVEKSAAVVGLAVGSGGDRLWIATNAELIAADAVTGDVLARGPPPPGGPISAMTAARAEDGSPTVWITQGSQLHRVGMSRTDRTVDWRALRRKSMTLNEQEAFNAMFAFLAEVYEQTQSDDIGSLLGSMSLLPDGRPIDPAVWSDWQKCVEQAKRGGVRSDFRFNTLARPGGESPKP